MTQLEKFIALIKNIDFFQPFSLDYLAPKDAFAYLGYIDDQNNFIEIWLSKNILGKLKFECKISNFMTIKNIQNSFTLTKCIKLKDLDTKPNMPIRNQIKIFWNESKTVKGVE